MIADDATDVRDLPALRSKEASEAKLALDTFTSGRTVKCMFSDRSKELKKVARDNGWVHKRATPHRPESHGVVEIKIRHTKEQARAILHSLACHTNGGHLQAAMPRW